MERNYCHHRLAIIIAGSQQSDCFQYITYVPLLVQLQGHCILMGAQPYIYIRTHGNERADQMFWPRLPCILFYYVPSQQVHQVESTCNFGGKLVDTVRVTLKIQVYSTWISSCGLLVLIYTWISSEVCALFFSRVIHIAISHVDY